MAKVVVLGAGRVGRALLRVLEAQKQSTTIVEENKDICDELAAESNATVVNGDATSPELLDEIKIGDMDYVFAVTGSEETNFLAAVYARQAGAKKIISRVTEPKHSLLLERLGVETVIPEITLAKELANRVTSPTIFRLLNPLESNIELVEKEVDQGLAKKKICRVNKEQNFNVVATFSEGKFHIAQADDILKKGTRIIIVREVG